MQVACKPGSVVMPKHHGCPFIYDVDCSTPPAAHPTVKRSETPVGFRRNHPACLALLPMGFTQPTQSPAPLVRSYRTISPLPGKPRTALPRSELLRRFTFCCTCPVLADGGRYPPSCSVEPGLSSLLTSQHSEHPATCGVMVVFSCRFSVFRPLNSVKLVVDGGFGRVVTDFISPQTAARVPVLLLKHQTLPAEHGSPNSFVAPRSRLRYHSRLTPPVNHTKAAPWLPVTQSVSILVRPTVFCPSSNWTLQLHRRKSWRSHSWSIVRRLKHGQHCRRSRGWRPMPKQHLVPVICRGNRTTTLRLGNSLVDSQLTTPTEQWVLPRAGCARSGQTDMDKSCHGRPRTTFQKYRRWRHRGATCSTWSPHGILRSRMRHWQINMWCSRFPPASTPLPAS